MGKGKKLKSASGDAMTMGALGDDLETLRQSQTFGKARQTARQNKKRTAKESKPEDGEEYISSDLSKKIIDEARKQQQELIDDEDDDGAQTCSAKKSRKSSNLRLDSSSKLRLSSSGDRAGGGSDDDEGGFEERFSDDEDGTTYLDSTAPLELDKSEEAALERFMSKAPLQSRTLADIIQEKIKEKESEAASQFSDVSMQLRQLDPRLVEMYRGVGHVLASYRSGKIPKAFKMIPKLVNWEQVLELTMPEKWTAAAIYQATRLFSSNLNARMCQRFYNLILLPRIRDDIEEFKKLNFHLYQALKKSLFKPAAFFKGILLPLCESSTCTLREATIIGSVMTKCTIPMLHAAAAMLKIAEMDYSGANSMFLRLLLDKKYTLPYQVIDALVFHFLRFQGDKRELPVLWHQALLVLCQRYKGDLGEEQVDSLMELVKVHFHPQITVEIRRELTHRTPRDKEEDTKTSMDYQ